MGIKYKKRKRGKNIHKIIEFAVQNRKEISDVVKDVADITRNTKHIIDHIRSRNKQGEGFRMTT